MQMMTISNARTPPMAIMSSITIGTSTSSPSTADAARKQSLMLVDMIGNVRWWGAARQSNSCLLEVAVIS